MKREFAAALACGILELSTACDTERKKECGQLIPTLAPLDDASPSAASIDRLRAALDAQALADQPLHEYASTLKASLLVLSGTLALREAPTPPDGTDDVVKEKMKEARAARDDVSHYCAE
jgi:hypothetical protein